MAFAPSTSANDEPARTPVPSGCLLVELRGFEPLTPTLPVWCATNCAIAPKMCLSKLHHGPPGFKVAAQDGLTARIEVPQAWRLLAGGDLLGQQPTGRGALFHPPHAVATGDKETAAHLPH
jgi:hypothetical protein